MVRQVGDDDGLPCIVNLAGSIVADIRPALPGEANAGIPTANKFSATGPTPGNWAPSRGRFAWGLSGSAQLLRGLAAAGGDGLRNPGRRAWSGPTMRCLMILSLLAATFSARAAVPQILQDAIKKVSLDTDRWAYTQTAIQKDDKGKTKSEVVVRFDPSKPYAEQYTPLKIDGEEPSESQRRKYRRQGEKRGEALVKAETTGEVDASTRRKSLGELMDIEKATVAEEDAETITYEVPLKKEGNDRLPPEKFRVLARLSKEQRVFDSISATLRSPLREKLIVKVSAGEGHIQFKTVDPKYPPQLADIRGSGSGSILFVPIGRAYELRREDYKRVKPYGDRFDVQIGTLKAIDF